MLELQVFFEYVIVRCPGHQLGSYLSVLYDHFGLSFPVTHHTQPTIINSYL